MYEACENWFAERRDLKLTVGEEHRILLVIGQVRGLAVIFGVPIMLWY